MTPSVIERIRAERAEQDRRFGRQDHQDTYWLAILVEEVGEVAAELQAPGPFDADRIERLKKELVQCAAVSVAWLEALEE